MHRICFYSDDSYGACGHKRHNVVVAGIALMADRTNINRALLEAEKRSKKGLADWHSTPAQVKEDYLEAVLDIAGIQGRVFYHLSMRCLPKSIGRQESQRYRQRLLDSLPATVTIGCCPRDLSSTPADNS